MNSENDPHATRNPRFGIMWFAMFVAYQFSMLDATAQFVHPGHHVTKEDLGEIKRRIQAGIEPQKSAYVRMMNEPFLSKSWTPSNVPRIERGGGGKPNIGHPLASKDAKAAYTQAIAYFLTGDPDYAKNSMRIYKAYGENLKEISGWDSRLSIGWVGGVFIYGLEILKYTYPDFDPAVETTFMTMFDKLYTTVLLGPYPTNNWGCAGNESLTATAIFKNDTAMFNKAIDNYKGYLNSNTASSGFPLAIRRDLEHAQEAVGSLVQNAELFWTQGVDVYSLDDNRLAKGVEILADSVLARLARKTKDSHDTPRASAWEMAYNHFHHRKGMAMPKTKALILAHIRPDFLDGEKWGLGSLLRGDFDDAGKTVLLADFSARGPRQFASQPKIVLFRLQGSNRDTDITGNNPLGASILVSPGSSAGPGTFERGYYSLSGQRVLKIYSRNLD